MVQIVMADSYDPEDPTTKLQFATMADAELYIRGYVDYKFLGVWHELIIAAGEIRVRAHEEGQRYEILAGTYEAIKT